ncbi:uncharacterized protein HKW66_Vig0125750 [Vigna angularis]|uniref:Uncharacterized protein n=1 Tax=Phaseolus angularis TaxID=3914 RepID=A0A8T0K3G9_PHAAN|nr:uncharacterized protein HKW66_Vig0125750 [Vigna angularis]
MEAAATKIEAAMRDRNGTTKPLDKWRQRQQRTRIEKHRRRRWNQRCQIIAPNVAEETTKAVGGGDHKERRRRGRQTAITGDGSKRDGSKQRRKQTTMEARGGVVAEAKEVVAEGEDLGGGGKDVGEMGFVDEVVVGSDDAGGEWFKMFLL